MPQSRRPSTRRTLGFALGLAFLLHAGLLLIHWERDAEESTSAGIVRRPVELVTLPEPSKAASPRPRAPVPLRRPPSDTKRPLATPAPEIREAASPREPVELDPSAGPRRLDLFPEELLSVRDPTAPGSLSEDPGTRAARRLEDWRSAWGEKERERIKVRTAELMDLERRIQSWFEPPTEAMREAGLRKMPWHESLPKVKLPYLDREIWKKLAMGVEGTHDRTPRAGPVQLPPPIVLCVVGCGESKKAALAAIIEVFHDDRGVPESWEIAESSGTPVFDNAALRAIDDTLRLHPGKMFDDPTQTPEWTRWQFAATGYWWRWGQLALSPTFKPHGRTKDEMTGFGGKTTVSREVKLLDTRFWPAEHVPE